MSKLSLNLNRQSPKKSQRLNQKLKLNPSPNLRRSLKLKPTPRVNLKPSPSRNLKLNRPLNPKLKLRPSLKPRASRNRKPKPSRKGDGRKVPRVHREGQRALREGVRITASPRWTEETRKAIIEP